MEKTPMASTEYGLENEKELSFLNECLPISKSFETTKDGGNTTKRIEWSADDNKTYGVNSGKLAFVTGDGSMYVTIATSEKINELEADGYENTALEVPLSEGNMPVNLDDRRKWLEISHVEME